VNFVCYESMWYPKSCGRILILREKFLIDTLRCESKSIFEEIIVIMILGFRVSHPRRQVTAHPIFVGHDPSEVPAYVMNRRQVSLRLVRPPDDIMMLHQINCASAVFRIRKASGRFPSTHKRVSTLVI